MTAFESAVLSYWRTSKAALSGNPLAAQKLVIISEHFKDDVAPIANAASRSLTAAAMRAAR